MSCERYWRDGIVLVERGLDDPHRDGCEDCTRAHASRQELIETIPWIGASYTGDPDWQAKVWRQIDGVRVPTLRRWRWQLAGGLAVACAFALWIGVDRGRPDLVGPDLAGPDLVGPDLVGPDPVRTPLEIIEHGVAMRSSDAHDPRVWSATVDDRLRVTVTETSEVWIYRAGRLVLQCPARQVSGQVSDRCTPAGHNMIVELVLSIPGTYQVIITTAPVAWRPRGGLDDDRADLESAGPSYKEHLVLVR